MKFTKMHGCGNSYIYVDCSRERVADPAGLAVKMSDKNFGVGADGLILIKPSDKASCFMEMYNADGSPSAMCGNGIRCVGRYMFEAGRAPDGKLTVDTFSGQKELVLDIEGGRFAGCTVNMGRPMLEAGEIPTTLVPSGTVLRHPLEIAGRQFEVTCISMGNPHVIIVVDDVASFPVAEYGPLLENHPAFPARTNVNFVECVDSSTLRVRTWERGSGETMACGTGNCASVVALTLLGLCGGEADTYPLGGKLHIRWDKKSSDVLMTGPAETIFTGEWPE